MNKHKLAIAVFAIALALFSQLVLAAPTGVSVTAGTPDTKGIFAVGDISALGGSVTNVTASTETQTVAWQGFVGNVLGNITLADASNNALYKWLLAKGGKVFASRDAAIDFANITAQNDCTIDEDLTGTGSDRVNNTFTASSNTELSVGGITISSNSACATHTYVNSTSQTTLFEEIILTDDGGITSIYAGKIADGAIGYDGNTYDFQMIVPDNKNETTTTYFFYAELE